MHLLTYDHTRDLFTKNKFKDWVKKYFKNVRYMGSIPGNYNPRIEISNWEETKGKLPKSYQPYKVLRVDVNRDSNLAVQQRDGFKYMDIRKEREKGNDVASLLMGIHRLKNREIHFLVINGLLIERKDFEFESSGNFNTSKAIEVLTWQFHNDILHDILKEKI